MEAAGVVLHERKLARLLWSLSGDWKGSGFQWEADDLSLGVTSTTTWRGRVFGLHG